MIVFQVQVQIFQTKQLSLELALEIQMSSTCAYFADEVWSHVGCVAELSTHLQVADATNGVPELCQAVGTCHQQSHVGSDVAKLRGKWRKHSDFLE